MAMPRGNNDPAGTLSRRRSCHASPFGVKSTSMVR
jgi:hypothetical protein